MVVQAARKVGPAEEIDQKQIDEKRRRGLALLMAAIWHRHNPPADAAGQDGSEDQSKAYLAEIW